MKNKKIYIALIALFLLIAAISGGICIHQLRDAREAADSFRDLEDMLVLPTVSTQPTESIASTERSRAAGRRTAPPSPEGDRSPHPHR